MLTLTDLVPSSVTMAAVALTLLAYGAALVAYRRSGASLLLPVLTGAALVASVLLVWRLPYEAYASGARPLTWLAGPATVALAVPLHRHWARLRGLWWPIIGALLAGSVTAVASAIAIAWLLGGDGVLQMSLAPKSATMPVAMPVASRLGGQASLSAVAVALTGIAGAVLAGALFRALRLNDEAIQGFALGTAAHAIGTARAVQISDAAVAFAALGMGMNAIVTGLLVPLLGLLR